MKTFEDVIEDVVEDDVEGFLVGCTTTPILAKLAGGVPSSMLFVGSTTPFGPFLLPLMDR